MWGYGSVLVSKVLPVQNAKYFQHILAGDAQVPKCLDAADPRDPPRVANKMPFWCIRGGGLFVLSSVGLLVGKERKEEAAVAQYLRTPCLRRYE